MDDVVAPLGHHAPNSLAERLSEYLEDDTFEESLTGFLEKYSEDIQFEEGSVEHKHGWYAIYEKFVALWERFLLDFMEKERIDNMEEFYAIAKEEMEVNAGSEKLFKALLAAADYDAFISLMKEYQEEMLEMGDEDDSD